MQFVHYEVQDLCSRTFSLTGPLWIFVEYTLLYSIEQHSFDLKRFLDFKVQQLTRCGAIVCNTHSTTLKPLKISFGWQVILETLFTIFVKKYLNIPTAINNSNALTNKRKKSMICLWCRPLISPSNHLIWPLWNDWIGYMWDKDRDKLFHSHIFFCFR